VSDRDGSARAAELRREFDRAFAEPARAEAVEAPVPLLALRAGADSCLVRLSDMQGLLARPTIVPLPGPLPELLGLTGVRGALLPVFSLAALRGQAAGGAVPPWMIVVEADGPVGLAFEEMLGYVTLKRSEVASLPRGSGAAETQAARVGDTLRPLIDVSSLVAELKRRAAQAVAYRQE